MISPLPLEEPLACPRDLSKCVAEPLSGLMESTEKVNNLEDLQVTNRA